jgi:hypothetical protein
MISRSDGNHFHLFLADRPLPYPIEKDAGATSKISVCFWYTHSARRHSTFSTIVILDACSAGRSSLFRRIEQVADLLADTLARDGKLATVYEFLENPSKN